MLFESLVVAFFVNSEAVLSAYLLRHLYRETEGIVKSESRLAVEFIALNVLEDLFYLFESVLESLGETFFFFGEFVYYLSSVDFELGIYVLIFFNIYLCEFNELGAVETDLSCESYAPSDKAAQNVSMIDVGRYDAALVADEESRGTDMVRNDSDTSRVFFVFTVLLATFF